MDKITSDRRNCSFMSWEMILLLKIYCFKTLITKAIQTKKNIKKQCRKYFVAKSWFDQNDHEYNLSLFIFNTLSLGVFLLLRPTTRACVCACVRVKLSASVHWRNFSLRQGSSLERWRVLLWTNFYKWGPSKGGWECISFLRAWSDTLNLTLKAFCNNVVFMVDCNFFCPICISGSRCMITRPFAKSTLGAATVHALYQM